MPEIDKLQYIGDGVYVRFDGYQLWLQTERETGLVEIALEPEVFLSLFEIAKRTWNLKVIK